MPSSLQLSNALNLTTNLYSEENALEASLVESLSVLPANHLLEVSAHLHQREPLQLWQREDRVTNQSTLQLNDIIGQQHANAHGGSRCGGPPSTFLWASGTGKTMLASRLSGILPPLSNQEALEVASIHSVAGKGLRQDIWFALLDPLTIPPQPQPWWAAAESQAWGNLFSAPWSIIS